MTTYLQFSVCFLKPYFVVIGIVCELHKLYLQHVIMTAK